MFRMLRSVEDRSDDDESDVTVDGVSTYADDGVEDSGELVPGGSARRQNHAHWEV